MGTQQYKRKAALYVIKPAADGTPQRGFADATPQELLDLSQLHFQFETRNQDEEGPSNCTVRVFNLSQTTVQKLIRYGYSQVVVEAGYEGSYGVIFRGNIKQFRVGRLNQLDSYVDILAADGDLAYAFGFINKTLSAGENSDAGVKGAISEAAQKFGIKLGQDLSLPAGGTKPRGKVMFGMLRAQVTDYANTHLSTWSIQDGKIVIIPLNGYIKGAAVKLTSQTGMIGVPEQTQDGVRVRCLINPRIIVGGRVWIDNASINQLVGQTVTNPSTPNVFVPYNQWAGVQLFANVANDGYYRVYTCEHVGDTRGQNWYSDLMCLAIDNSSENVKPYGE